MKAEWNKINRSPYAIDYFFLGISVWWLVVLLFPYGTFSYGKKGPSGDWGILSAVARPSVWGFLLSFSIIFLLGSIIYKKKNIYRAAVLSQALWWWLISFTIISTEPLSTSSLTYFLIGCLSFYYFITAHYLTPMSHKTTEELDFERNMHTPVEATDAIDAE